MLQFLPQGDRFAVLGDDHVLWDQAKFAHLRMEIADLLGLHLKGITADFVFCASITCVEDTCMPAKHIDLHARPIATIECS